MENRVFISAENLREITITEEPTVFTPQVTPSSHGQSSLTAITSIPIQTPYTGTADTPVGLTSTLTCGLSLGPSCTLISTSSVSTSSASHKTTSYHKTSRTSTSYSTISLIGASSVDKVAETSSLPHSTLLGIIGGVVALVVLLLVGGIWLCIRRRYPRSVSELPNLARNYTADQSTTRVTKNSISLPQVTAVLQEVPAIPSRTDLVTSSRNVPTIRLSGTSSHQHRLPATSSIRDFGERSLPPVTEHNDSLPNSPISSQQIRTIRHAFHTTSQSQSPTLSEQTTEFFSPSGPLTPSTNVKAHGYLNPQALIHYQQLRARGLSHEEILLHDSGGDSNSLRSRSAVNEEAERVNTEVGDNGLVNQEMVNEENVNGGTRNRRMVNGRLVNDGSENLHSSDTSVVNDKGRDVPAPLNIRKTAA